MAPRTVSGSHPVAATTSATVAPLGRLNMRISISCLLPVRRWRTWREGASAVVSPALAASGFLPALPERATTLTPRGGRPTLLR